MGEPSDGNEHGPKPGGREAPVAQKSGPAAPPVIAVRMETLLAWVVERVAKFPREHKFTVGDRLVETCRVAAGVTIHSPPSGRRASAS